MGERWQFRLCGTMVHMGLECTNTITNAEALYDELADGFNAEEGSEVTFHFSDEDCSARKPLQEPSNLSPANRSIQVHFDRPITTTVPWTAQLLFKFEAGVKGYDTVVWMPCFMPNDDDEATVAVRLVSHLPTEATQDVNLEDQNCPLWLNNDDSAATAEQNIVQWMRDNEDEGRYVLRPIFFEGSLKDTWKCELWVMPQNSTSFTLFRFDEQNTGFSDFLDQEHVDAGDLKVYMECHIWPKDAETVTGL